MDSARLRKQYPRVLVGTGECPGMESTIVTPCMGKLARNEIELRKP